MQEQYSQLRYEHVLCLLRQALLAAESKQQVCDCHLYCPSKKSSTSKLTVQGLSGFNEGVLCLASIPALHTNFAYTCAQQKQFCVGATGGRRWLKRIGLRSRSSAMSSWRTGTTAGESQKNNKR
eukprot:1160527-Pelagomonas_calceolata.AAC.5